MLKKELKSLPCHTVRLLGSSQVITSVFSVVKELVENSFDAASSNLEIKLDNYGLDKVEVRDNGCGMRGDTIPLVAKRHHTSKITSFSDLEHLQTYGFRGEALGSLCAVSTLCVTSKSMEEDVSHTYTFDNHGNIVSRLPSHLGQGTTISAINIFKNMPVRRQFYNTMKKKREELKQIEDLLMAYGAIRPDVRIVLRNNKETVWQKPVQLETKCVLSSIFGRNTVTQMQHRVADCHETKIRLEAYLPNSDSDVTVTSRSTNDRCFLAVNKRPVQLKYIEKVVKHHYCHRLSCEGRHPVFYIHVTVPCGEIDVNVDPNKTRVMLHQQSSVMELLTTVLEDIYGRIPKPTEAEKPRSSEMLNDSSLSNISFDSSYDTTISEMADSALRPCLQMQKDNTDGSVKFQKSKNSDDSNTVPISTVSFDNVSAKSGRCIDDLVNTSKPTELQFGNRLVVQHSENRENNGRIVTSNMKTNPISLMDCMQSNEIIDAGRSEGRNDYCNVKESGNNTDTGYREFMTQLEEGSFDILDDDLEDLLKTQNTKTTGITLAGDIGEIGEKVDDETNEVCNLNSRVVQERNEACGEGSMTKILDWSKGRAEKQCGGEVIQPVQLLVGGSHVTRKRPLSPIQDVEILAATPPAKRKSSEFSLDQPKLYDLIGKSPIDKSSLGFLAFSKEMRPKVLEDQPDSSYDEITGMVRRCWQQLPELDKKQFEDTGISQVQALKKKVSEQKRLAQKIDRRVQAVNGTPSIKDQLLASSKKMTAPNVPVKCVKVSFCVKKLQQLYSSGLKQTQAQQKSRLRLIGPLKFYNSWVCCHGSVIQIVNPHRIEETLLHRELMENHIIPAAKLHNTIGINESCIGGADLYKKLLEMVPTNKAQTYVYIDDKRLKANGIEIRCHLDESSSPVLEIVGLATCMPTYGVRDLQEVLELIVNNGANTVYHARSLKVTFYLQGEAVRMIRQRPVHRSREDMRELLEQMDDSLPADCVNCLHNKPFINSVYNMNDIPMSQSVSHLNL